MSFPKKLFLESAFGNISGISEIGNLLYNWNNSNPWLLDSPDMYRNMIQVELKDLNMFNAPQFLHSSNVLLVKSEDGVLPGVEANGVLGALDLEKLVLPTTAQVKI